MIDINQIMEMIPHRYPFLMVDRVTEVVPGERALGIKNVTLNEPHFTGHFPRKPVMPGVLIIEALAQVSAVLVVETLEGAAAGKLVYFTSIEQARFRRPVEPGDQLMLHSKALRHKRNLWKFEVFAEVDGQRAAEAQIAAMIMED